MELILCPNCLAAYGDVQSECPTCGADPSGAGAEPELDGTTRAAISALGGLFGGILEGPDGGQLLWCARGVCLVEDERGLVWRSPVLGRVEGITVGADGIHVATGRAEVVLGLEDGVPL